jgi:hypothetical protein
VLLGRDALQRLAEELLKQPMFMQLLTTAFQKGMETKGRVDRNMQTLLGLLNLPSKADITRLNAKIEVLQGAVGNLTRQLDKMATADAQRRKRRDERRSKRAAD